MDPVQALLQEMAKNRPITSERRGYESLQNGVEHQSFGSLDHLDNRRPPSLSRSQRRIRDFAFRAGGVGPGGFLADAEGLRAGGYQADGYQTDGFRADGYQPGGYQPDNYQPDGFPVQTRPLDDYDRALLAEPARDRQWQATQGMGRLSLPPRPVASSQMASSIDSDKHYQDHPQHPQRQQFSRNRSRPTSEYLQAVPSNFIPNRHFLPESSSPIAFQGPSSPSFQVNQRRISYTQRRNEGLSQNTVVRRQPDLDLEHANAPPPRKASNSAIAPPVVQGIQLISPHELADRFRYVFPYKLFNAVQSRCFPTVYNSNDNLVLSAPTGSGKTVILELAICRLVAGFNADQFKIIYMAPTKSLCSERQRDWESKFRDLGLQCAELTGDTEQTQLRNVQTAQLIITTPEKWDSMTRKWKDHSKLIQLVKLFLIDEVHILRDARGATLEAVVSRMKSVGSNVRFVALSATVPNSDDIATWLGKDQNNQRVPARREVFGEDFRPVPLQKHVYGLASNSNDFAFDTVCDRKLADIIAKHSSQKPIMVFCCTRKSTQSTAKLLAKWWSDARPRDRQWPGPTQVARVQDPELQGVLEAGVSFHHAGLDGHDRQIIERGFLNGEVNVICCTSTLAVGVNLPCHMVIIKNTVGWQNEGLKEYADLEMMQMMGRAGRPQFDSSAVAIIITRKEKVKKYEKLVSGEEILESCLHLNLIDHLNAEIGLGTVNDLSTAKRWLAGTFLFVRMAQNPNHYKLDGETMGRSLDDSIEQICDRDIGLLQETTLVSLGQQLKATAFGEAMARYYVKFGTMKDILSLPPRAKMSEMLSILVGAEEFHDVRFRSGEKSLYKALNSASGIKFPIKVDIALATQKRSIILQAELGGVDFPNDEQFVKHRRQFQQDKTTLFNHIHRLVRCMADCQTYLGDAPAVRNTLELGRSLAAKVWDNSPLQMKQIPSLGPVAVRKLVSKGINSIEALEATEAHQINMHMSRQPGFGEKILSLLKSFPKLRVGIRMMGKEVRPGRPPKINIKAEIGFLNEKVPLTFSRKPIYVCFVAERSDGHLLEFRRLSAKNIGNGEDILLSAELLNESHYIICTVMCDELAGTSQYAELKPGLPSSVFPLRLQPTPIDSAPSRTKPVMNISRRRSANVTDLRLASDLIAQQDDIFDDQIDDTDMLAAADRLDFQDLDMIEASTDYRPSPALQRRADHHGPIEDPNPTEDDWEPQRLQNGKWACNHKCKNKTRCKHLCCREGVDKAPKAPKNASTPKEVVKGKEIRAQSKLSAGTTAIPKQPKRIANQSNIETVDLSGSRTRESYAQVAPRAFRSLHKLHESVTSKAPAKLAPTKPFSSNAQGKRPKLSFLSRPSNAQNSEGVGSTEPDPSDYGNDSWDDCPPLSALLKKTEPELVSVTAGDDDNNCNIDDDLSDLEAGMADLDDPVENEATTPVKTQAVPWYENDDFFAVDFDHGNPSTSARLNDDPKEEVSLGRPESLNHQNAKRSRSEANHVDQHIEANTDETTKAGGETIEEPLTKRQKIDVSEPLQSAPATGNRGLPSDQAEKLKRFAGVNLEGIDLEFLAQYADYIEEIIE